MSVKIYRLPDPQVIRERRQEIEDAAPCVGCGSTLRDCFANRGKDPTAPIWFGCCARGPGMQACHHVPDQAALRALLEEIEQGNVRTVDETLLDSISEYGRPRRWLPPVCMIPDCGCLGEEHA